MYESDELWEKQDGTRYWMAFCGEGVWVLLFTQLCAINFHFKKLLNCVLQRLFDWSRRKSESIPVRRLTIVR